MQKIPSMMVKKKIKLQKLHHLSSLDIHDTHSPLTPNQKAPMMSEKLRKSLDCAQQFDFKNIKHASTEDFFAGKTEVFTLLERQSESEHTSRMSVFRTSVHLPHVIPCQKVSKFELLLDPQPHVLGQGI